MGMGRTILPARSMEKIAHHQVDPARGTPGHRDTVGRLVAATVVLLAAIGVASIFGQSLLAFISPSTSAELAKDPEIRRKPP